MSEDENNEEKKPFDYFKMSKALDEVKSSYGTKEKAVSALKLVGKGLFNSAKFVAENGPKAVHDFSKNAAYSSMKQSEKALKRKDLSEEQREKLMDINNRSREQYQELKEQEKEKGW